MREATLRQGNQVVNLILQKGTPSEQLQQLIASGLLSDLLDANVECVDRAELRKVLGLRPLEESPKKDSRSKDPFDRYLWLRKYPIADLLEIEDAISGTTIGTGGGGMKSLKILPAKVVNSEELQALADVATKQWQLTECLVLNKYGHEIGHYLCDYRDGIGLDWEFDFADAAFLLLTNFGSCETLVVYEILR